MNKSKETIGVLSKTFRGYRKHFVVLTILGIVGAALEGIGVNAIIPLFSFLLGNGNSLPTDFISKALQSFFNLMGVPFTLRFLLVFITILLLTRALALAVFAYIRARISASFMYHEMNYMFSRTLRARWLFLVAQKSGYLQNTLFWDVKQSTNLLDTVVQFTQSSTGFIMYFLIAFSISPTIMLVTLAAGAIMLALLRPFVRRTTMFGEEKSTLEKSFANHLIEHVIGLKSVKASGIEKKVAEKGRILLDRLRVAYAKSAVMHSLGTAFIQPFSFIFILILFAFAYKLPSFNIAAFAAVLYLIQKIFVYLESTQSTLHSIAELVPFAANTLRFKDALRENSEVSQEAGHHFVFKRELAFKDVALSYRPGESVLSSISFAIPKDTMTGIIGVSGGGKTTVADLMLRLFRPDSGNILLDGVPIETIRMDEWQKHIGYVSQDIFLINASIKDNIRFYDDSISDEAIKKAAQQAHIYDFIVGLENGFDAIVGERGTTLSAGQRQRIAFARALARTPSILILDEATSALDSESELAIKETIDDIRKAVTLVVIAHRISTIMSADNLIVLKGGSIAEYGKPRDMLQDEKSYLSHMVKLQNSSLI